LINSNLIKKKQIESRPGKGPDLAQAGAKTEQAPKIKEGTELYSMLPFMNKYAEGINQKHFDYHEMHLNTCSYYAGMVRGLFLRTDVEAHRSEQQPIRDAINQH
jgi:hypothetical protein